MTNYPTAVIKSEIFWVNPGIINPFNSKEHAKQPDIFTKPSHTIARHRLEYIQPNEPSKPIEHTDTFQRAFEAMAAHLGVPAERQGDFARAIDALAKDACSATPRLIPLVLGTSQAETPGTVVTKPTPWLALDFPKVAPEKWPVRGKGDKYQEGDETPEAFAVRVYGQWMRPSEPHRSIGMPEILHLDEPLYHALRRSNRHDKPEGFCLPSKKERNDAQIALKKSGPIDDMSAKEWLRLRSLENYRRYGR